MRVARLSTAGVATVVVSGMLAAPLAFGVSGTHRAHPASTPRVSTVGRIAYLTKQGVLKTATVRSDGTTSSVKKLGPITKASGKQTVRLSDVVVSGNGHWIAWNEELLSHGGALLHASLVDVHEPAGTAYQVKSLQEPVGFAGSRLVTYSGSTKRLVLTPKPHLVKVDDSGLPLATYAHGVIDSKALEAPKGPSQTWEVRLTSFAGSHVVLHRYVLSPTDFRYPDLAWVSGDGKRVVVERGNHQDFGGLGPSSLADEFHLTAPHSRATLGHYGTDKAAWRIGGVAFAGSSNSVWAMWERLTTTGATSVVARYKSGAWKLEEAHGVAVAANAHGDVITQPGKWVNPSKVEEEFEPVPSGDARLRDGAGTVTLHASGSFFAFIA
ncbi:MAG TPA: hypothetical protein VME70_05785 [Mycobacteriales bacterium]|nr:hypothetical protein [Mycobacteriales bacterium]